MDYVLCFTCLIGLLGLVGASYVLSIVTKPRTLKQRLIILEAYVEHFESIDSNWSLSAARQTQELKQTADLILELLPEGFGIFEEGYVIFSVRDPKGAKIGIEGVKAYIRNMRGTLH